jgi:diacylglycerol O-acyltransferase
MKSPTLRRRLSSVDAAFLYLERKEIPLHIASVSTFDGRIPFEEFVAAIESKLHLIPRYRQVVVTPPFNLGPPHWEDDPAFDIRRHILRSRVRAPGGEAELEAAASRILGQVMDRSKPLWDIHVLEGLKGGRGALIARVHHSLADGISGEALLKVMLGDTPESSFAIPKQKLPRRRQAAPNHSLKAAIGNAVQGTVENLLTADAITVGLAEALLDDRMQKAIRGLRSLLPEFAASIERLPFNRQCTGDRKFCWAECSFAEVKAIREVAGGTVNDVILSVVTRAIARYVKLHKQTVTKRFIRVVCPVSMRRADDGQSMGNRITFLPVALPLYIRDPVEMLKAVALRMEIMKSAHVADLVALLASWLGAVPPALQSLFWSTIPDIPMPVPLLNIICTNVPGSPVPLYAAGRRMIASYPHVPTGYELGVGCAVQSYDGKLFFGLTADAHVAADVGRLRDFIVEAFEQLCKATGIARTERGRPAAAAQKQAGKTNGHYAAEVPKPKAEVARRATEPPLAPQRIDAAKRA